MLLVICLLPSCGLPDIRIKRKVATSELVGTWVLDPKSSAMAKDHDGDTYVPATGQPHTIVFNADGTCHYRSVLQMPTRYVDASGDWSIVTPTDNPKGCEVKIILNSASTGTTQFSLDLKEESGHLILWQFWSDPDLWNFLEYKRTQAEQGASPSRP